MSVFVPQGSKVMIGFDPAALTFLSELGSQIQSNVGLFVSQSSNSVFGSSANENAFSLSVLEISSSLTTQYVLGALNDVGSRTKRIAGKILPQCRVCENGDVRLKVSSPDVVQLGSELLGSLHGSNNFFSETDDSLFITIGTFRDVAQHIEFQLWLNKELQTNASLFPTFYSDYLHLSEEWRSSFGAFRDIAPSIPLSGSAAATGSGLLNGVLGLDNIDNMEGLLESFTNIDDEGEDATTAGSKIQVGEGNQADTVLGNILDEEVSPAAEEVEDVHAAAPVPRGPTISSVGKHVWGGKQGKPPSAILAMREGAGGVAPAPRPVLAKTSPRTVAAVPVAKPAAIAPAQAASAAAAPAAAASATTTTAPAATAATGSTSTAEKNWVCPSCKLMVYGHRVQCFKCKTAKPANPEVSTNQGTQGDRGDRGGDYANRASGAGGSGEPRAARAGTHHIYPRKPKDGDVRDGDWSCEVCKGHNFANKIACFTCRSPRPAGYVIAPGSEDGAEGGAEGAAPKPVDRKPGDWTCPKCDENVFAKRNRCYKCSTSKPKSMGAGAGGAPASRSAST